MTMSKREHARKYLAPFIDQLAVGETVNVVSDLVHDAHGEWDADRFGRQGTSIRPWANKRTDLLIEPDPRNLTVKITRLAPPTVYGTATPHRHYGWHAKEQAEGR